MDDQLNTLAIDLITELLLERTGQALKVDRQWRIEAALQTVLRRRGIGTTRDLLVLLTQPESKALQQELVEALLNNETYFFRDRQIFDFLARQVLPQLAEARRLTRRLTVWSAGCSTGQEALSLAMLFRQDRARWDGWTIEIVASDVSEQALRVARNATYSNFEIQRGLGVGQMLAWFEETSEGWRASDELLRMIRFERRNLLDGAPGGMTFDLVLCRNLMLYLDHEARATACRALAQAMHADSQLLLGGGELIRPGAAPLVPVPGDFALYRLAPTHTGAIPLAALV